MDLSSYSPALVLVVVVSLALAPFVAVMVTSFTTQVTIMTDLRGMRDAISGVNVDEELSDIIKFQHGYNAAARFIATFNEMLDTVINRMGV